MSKPAFSKVISNQGFCYLWLNQVLIQLAINTLNFALIIWVFKLTNSNLAVSAFIFSVYLPALLFGIFAGVFIDLLDRRKLIILIDLLAALLLMSFILIKNSYPLILLNTFLINSCFQFFMPAENSSIPLLVSRRELLVANSLFSFTLYGSLLIGFTLAGPILNLFGINAIFLLGALSLLLAFFISQNLPPLKTTEIKVPWVFDRILSLTISETKNILEFVKGKLNVASSIALLVAIQGVIGILAVLFPSYMERTLRIQAEDASLVLMLPLGLGMVLGALCIGRILGGFPKRMVVIPAIIMAGILLFIVGVAPALARFFNATELPEHIPRLRYFFNAPSLSSTYALGAFLLGVTAVSIIIPSQTTLQEATKKQIRGKIFAVLGMLMNAVAIIPVLLAGGLADLFGETAIFLGLGVTVFTIGILALKPNLFFTKKALPFKIREFLGLGHWEVNK